MTLPALPSRADAVPEDTMEGSARFPHFEGGGTVTGADRTYRHLCCRISVTYLVAMMPEEKLQETEYQSKKYGADTVNDLSLIHI